MKKCEKCNLDPIPKTDHGEQDACPVCVQIDYLLKQMLVDTLPGYMREGVDVYLRHGIVGPDSFIEAVFRDKFSDVLRKADTENRNHLVEWARAMYWAPMNARGASVNDWIQQGGLAGAYRTEEQKERMRKEAEDE